MFSTSIATAANMGAPSIGSWTTRAGPRAVKARLPSPKIVSATFGCSRSRASDSRQRFNLKRFGDLRSEEERCRPRTPHNLYGSRLSRISRLARWLVRATKTRAPDRRRIRQRHQRHRICRSGPRRGSGATRPHLVGRPKFESSATHTGSARPYLRHRVSQRRQLAGSKELHRSHQEN